MYTYYTWNDLTRGVTFGIAPIQQQVLNHKGRKLRSDWLAALILYIGRQLAVQ